MGGPKGWGPKKKVANIEIYVIFEVFAFCGRRTKTDFKDRVPLAMQACTGFDWDWDLKRGKVEFAITNDGIDLVWVWASKLCG